MVWRGGSWRRRSFGVVVGLGMCRGLSEGGIVAGRARQQAEPVPAALAEHPEQLVIGEELSLC